MFFQRKSASVFHTLTVFFIVSICLSFHIWLMREFLFCCIVRVVSRSLLECSFGRVTESSLRAKQTAVAYG